MSFKDMLCDDWNLVWKKWSARLNAAGATVLAFFTAYPQMVENAWDNLPDSIRSNFPAKTVMWLGVCLVVSGSIAQFFRQRKLDELRNKQ